MLLSQKNIVGRTGLWSWDIRHDRIGWRDAVFCGEFPIKSPACTTAPVFNCRDSNIDQKILHDPEKKWPNAWVMTDERWRKVDISLHELRADRRAGNKCWFCMKDQSCAAAGSIQECGLLYAVSK